MAAPCYLRRVDGRYVFRRRVPLGIRSRLSRAEVVRGLGPCTLTEAKRRARRLAAASDELFAMVASDDTLTPERIDEIARAYFGRLTRADERRLCRFQPEDEDDLRRELDIVRREQEGCTELLRINDWAAPRDIVDRLLAEAGIEAAFGDDVYRDLSRKVLRALTEAARLQVGRLHGDYGVEPRDALFKRPPAVSAAAAPAERPAPRLVEAAPRLGELVAAHLEAMARAWTPQTRHQNAATLRLFLEHAGDRPVDGIARRDVSAFLDALGRLPSKYGQQRAFRGKGLREMLALAEATPGPRLSRKTLNRHASALSGLFTWARDHGRWAGESPASGFVDKRAAAAGGGVGPRRRRWRREELDRLFASPAWTGCRDARRRSMPGTMIIRDARYWAPLIGLYMGLRLEEIAKLRADDVRADDGIWAVDVVGNEAGRVKEHTSNRTVPVHPLLVRLGLIEHVGAIRAAGGGALWPELKRGGVDGKLGVGLSKWFGAYCAEIGVKAAGLTFHSLRKNLATGLHGLGVAEAIASDLLGHEHGSLSYRLYSEGPRLRTLYEALARVEYGLAIERDGLPAAAGSGRREAAPTGSGTPGQARPERPRATARARGPRDDSAGSARPRRGAGAGRTVAGDDRATRAERAAAAATALRRRAGGRGPSPAEAS